MKRKPYTIRKLWGIWLLDGGEDGNGEWLQHANGHGDENGPEVYASYTEAVSAADLYKKLGDFPGCYAAPITDAAKEAE